MGFCFSCCRRRKRPSDEQSDREPLLQSQRHTTRMLGGSSDALPPPKTPYERIADVVAALGAGKLPSQEQLHEVLRRLLASGVLDSSTSSEDPSSVAGEEEIEETGRHVVESARDVAQAALQFGMEKNDDNRIQELVYQLRQITSTPVHADVAVDVTQPGKVDVDDIAQQIPSTDEAADDAATLLRSIYSLAYVLATSAAFRLILSDVLLVARETTADVAANVEKIAEVVVERAAETERTVRPGGGTVEDVKNTAGATSERLVDELEHDGTISGGVDSIKEEVQHETPDKVKEAVMRRLQEAVSQAHEHPSFQRALRTILSLIRKYAEKIRSAAAVASAAEAPRVEITPVVWTDPQLAQALKHLKVLLERTASGHPLDGLLKALSMVIVDVVVVPAEAVSDNDTTAALRDWCAALGEWLDNALVDPGYATSPAGRERASELYDRAHAQVDEATADPGAGWLTHLRALFDEADAYITALARDRTTRRLVDALAELVSSFTGMGATVASTAPAIAQARAQDAKRESVLGVVRWLLPRVLRVVSVIPMPRVEFMNDTVEAAVDALLLTAPRQRESGEVLGVQASLVPDRVRVESWNEVVVDVDNALPLRLGAGGSGAGTAHTSAGLMTLVAGTGHESLSGRGLAATRTRTRTTTRVETHARTRARVHVEGVRVAARDVAYYVRYKGARWCGARVPCTAYEDEGLVSVSVGAVEGDVRAVKGTGLAMDVELELDGGKRTRREGWAAWLTPRPQAAAANNASDGEGGGEASPLFRVTDVRVDVPGMLVEFARTRHWVLNSLVIQPLAGPVVRAAVGWILAGQIRGALEAAAALGGRIKARAEAKAREEGRESSFDGWWAALVEEVGSSGLPPRDSEGFVDSEEEEPGSDAAEDAPLLETHTHVGVQGVVRKTVSHPPLGTDAEPEESVLAVGVGAQVLPGKGGPYGAPHPPARALEGGLEGVQARAVLEAREAVDDVARVEERAEDVVREGVEEVQRMREDVRDAEARADVRARLEGKRKGWRSCAFDL
ncbi:hypothetical protein BD413DRAFT_606873 [Trametes elegans]|nr:hypothetical protein BD413DRAFT_606873 [Trametes elegans]